MARNKMQESVRIAELKSKLESRESEVAER